MKKLMALMLALAMLCAAACAEGVTLQPVHAVDMTDYGTGDCTLKARFNPETAFDDRNNMTYTVLQDDLYAAEDVKALKAGDKVVYAGEEGTVESVQGTEYGVDVTTDKGVFTFYYADDVYMEAGEDDCSPYASVMGVYTFPLADQVKVTVWTLEADGTIAEDMTGQTLAAADVKAFFMARSDMEQEDYLNTESGNHTTVRVQDGKVTEITVDWGSDD